MLLKPTTLISRNTLALAVCALGLLSGCGKEFLDLQPRNAVTTEIFYKTQNDAIQATNAAYSQLSQNGMFNYSLWGIGDVMSDNSFLGGGGAADGIEFQQLDNFTIPATNPLTTSHWQRAYLGVGQANQVLARVPAIEMDATIKNRCLGEAAFLRALYYFYLVRGFGDVPLVLTPPQSAAEAAGLSRTPQAQVYAQIEKDLLDAITKLPATYSGEDVGRATKWAAMGLLAKVYLTEGKMTDAATQARRVIAESGKSLWTNYGDNFKVENENGQESLFEVQFKNGLSSYTTDGPGSVMNEFWGARFFGSPYVVSSGGYGFNIPEKEFVDGYEPGDLRKGPTVFVPGDKYPDGQVQPASLVGDPFGFNIRKFFVGTVNVNNWDSPLNVPVLRLGEIYLILAEAAGPADGLAAINTVRRRAFGNSQHDLPAGLSPEAFQKAVLKERRYELAFEMDRWYDLKRTGTLVSTMSALGKTVKETNNLLPIPQSERNVNPNLTQNPGY
ncbi:RagB/SusD family nutrient uptake outer membrane protein [Hymenobacter metallicola]|uniref:RagB/SusD family nutrient uptake outer membrane protein n=1 Tax=Hymenobacter metallicola TaxID=2563114 RepID=A0A4Z0QEP7_9BACT|nr:RagB/SusD family nutrient uptake outer membrane protein [Hymenobacter metallicola]TGE27202.1 RagB/SusD family nutrient uptake outer membrane protein [Hymenobacter metallicola]